MKRKNLFIIISFLIIVGIVIDYLLINKNNDTNKVFIIYEDSSPYPVLNSQYYISDFKHHFKDTKVGEYACREADCESYIFVRDNVVIYDGQYYIYNFIKDELTKIDLGTTRYKRIELQEIEGNLIGAVVYNDNDYTSFYSFRDKRFITNFIYNNIWVYNNDMYNDGYMFATKPTNVQYENNFYVIDANTEKVMLESNVIIEVISKNGYVYYEASRDQYDKVKIYNSHLDLLFNGDKYSLYKLAITDDGNLIVANNDERVFKEYNSDGQLLFTSKEYKNIGNVNDGLISVIDEDGYLKVIDYNGNEKVNFIKFTENLDLYDVTSYISSNNVELVVKDNKGYCQKFYYDFTTKEKRVEEADLCDAG